MVSALAIARNPTWLKHCAISTANKPIALAPYMTSTEQQRATYLFDDVPTFPRQGTYKQSYGT